MGTLYLCTMVMDVSFWNVTRARDIIIPVWYVVVHECL